MTINCRCLMLLIGLAPSVWGVVQIIAPSIAQASTDRLAFYVERQVNETYESLERRAEEAAMTLAQQSFDHDSQVSKVVVIVTAGNNGAIAPILKLQVSRSQWEHRRQPQRWITDLNASKTLLGFETPIPASINTPNLNSLPPTVLPAEPPGSPL